MSAHPSALDQLEQAFNNLRLSVSPTDAQNFKDTKLEDVWKAAKELETILAKKQSLRNLRRIEPFLRGLGHYSESIQLLCNGTPYLPWIWVRRANPKTSGLGSFKAHNL